MEFAGRVLWEFSRICDIHGVTARYQGQRGGHGCSYSWGRDSISRRVFAGRHEIQQQW